MRNKEEVQVEIDWREKEIKDLLEKIKLNDPNKDYYLNRITHLRFALEWCKWFLNEK